MAKSLYNFTDVEANNPTPITVTEALKDVARQCYPDMERFLMPPGVSGSRSFDQAYAVDILLRCDADNGGRLATIMESTGMSRRIIWDRLQSVLRSVGFKMKHGRLVGVIEDQRPEEEKNGDIGQPDID